MRKLLALSLCLVAGVALGAFVTGNSLHVRAGTPAPVATRNGDTNGDGVIDISDAVYILLYLFQSGHAPAAEPDRSELIAKIEKLEAELLESLGRVEQLEALLLECQARVITPSSRLLATGQKACYDDAGNEIACDNPDWPGQDGYYHIGCPMEGRFVDNGDGTITDKCTGLMWQQETAPGQFWWKEALQYCKNLDLAGHADWRLPNIQELETLIPYSSREAPFVDPKPDRSDLYWSSSTYPGGLENAWVGNVIDTGANRKYDSPNYPLSVRAVRGP